MHQQPQMRQHSSAALASCSGRVPCVSKAVHVPNRSNVKRMPTVKVNFNSSGKAPAEMAGKTVRLSFKLPYRVSFGQHVAIVGSSDALGNWDPSNAVAMAWGEGDVWSVELEVAAGPALELEYKYVVRNADGNVAVWKPGSNFTLGGDDAGGSGGGGGSFAGSSSVDGAGAAAAAGAAAGAPAAMMAAGGVVSVRDAWDGSARDVRLELREAPGAAPRPLTAAEREADAFRDSLRLALDDLSAQLGTAESVDAAADPTSPDLLRADRLVAAAARKAVAVAGALTAAEARLRLTEGGDGEEGGAAGGDAAAGEGGSSGSGGANNA